MKNTSKNIILAVVFLVLFNTLIISCNSQTKEHNVENNTEKSTTTINEFSKKEIYDELVARAANENKNSDTVIPQDKALEDFSNKDLFTGIYCNDDRINLYETSNAQLISDSKKVACLIRKGQLQKNEKGTYSLNVSIFKVKDTLCDDEPFADEPVCSFCSGFAIDKDIFVTAGHCVDSTNYRTKLIVYGYVVAEKGHANLEIASSDVYEISEVWHREYKNGTTNDYCLIKPNRPFSVNRIATIRRLGKVNSNDSLHAIGYPKGLPLKITPNGKIFNNSYTNRFITDLDTYRGNSGSPVFNSRTHIVEGILVNGYEDFTTITLDQKCKRSFRCPCEVPGMCSGEGVSRVSQFWKWLK